MSKKLVDIYMASLWRQGHIVKTVNSLLLNPEVGSITISCNNYTDKQWQYVNSNLTDTKINLHRTNNEKCSNEKLRFIGNGKNYYICFADDDLIYPPDYFNRLIKGCEKYNAMVSMHGRILPTKPLTSYYKQALVVLSHSGDVDQDYEVDIASNCGSLFKRNFFDDLDTWYDFCGNISMDDIYINSFMHKKGIKRFVLKHKKGLLKHKKKDPKDNYVYDKFKNNDQIQTEFYNKHFDLKDNDYNNFLITGFGRSGTMFLSNTMNLSKKWTVLHEPRRAIDEKKPTKKMLRDFSNNYYGEVNSRMRYRFYDVDVKKRGIIIRDSKEITLSVANRKTTKDTINIIENIYEWCENFYNWLKEDDSIIKINFKKMTSDLDYLKWIFDEFGITDVDMSSIDLNKKININKVISYESFNDLPKSVKDKYNEYKWRW